MAMVNPIPSSPTRLAAGTRTSSNDTAAVGLPRSPILSSWAATSTPQSGLDDEAADPPPPGGGIGDGEDRIGVRDPGIGDPVLVPCQEIVVAVPHRPRPHGGHVAAGIRLGQAVAGLVLSGGDRRQVPLLQLLGSPVHHRQHPELGDQQCHRGGCADPGHLLGHDRLGHHVRPGAAVLGRHTQRRQFELHTGVERLPWEGRAAVGLGGVGGDALLGEPPEGVAELSVGVLQGEGGGLHPHKLPTGSQGARTAGRPGAGPVGVRQGRFGR